MEDLSPIPDLELNLSKDFKEAQVKKIMNIIIQTWGGIEVYIPCINTINRLRRNERIRLQFNGANIKELAIIHDLSTRAIRKILEKD